MATTASPGTVSFVSNTRVGRIRSAHPVDGALLYGPGTRPRAPARAEDPSRQRPLTDQIEDVVESWATSQYELVTLAAEFADSPEWILTGSPTAAHWLAIIADVEPCTCREWIRIGRLLKTLPATADAWPSVAQQGAGAIEALLTDGAGSVDTEIVVHVSGNGNTLDDGTPLSDSIVAKLVPESFIRALIHDSHNNPIDATNRRRHPNMRQKRLVKARDQHCVDCGRKELSNTTMSPPTRKPATPSPPNSGSGAPPATTNAMAVDDDRGDFTASGQAVGLGELDDGWVGVGE